VAIEIKRIYDPVDRRDGYRVLVDRLWPRGVTKERAALDEWAKDLAPSEDLQKRFHGRPPERWQEFRRAYAKELRGREDVERLRKLAKRRRVTLLFAAKDEKRNNARVLADVLKR
jgi:uncharacterized protein YeaO (DUF488 family)